ncbi:MAG: translocation/assembly module TamB domain-containing protein [Desulfobacterales bacterium]
MTERLIKILIIVPAVAVMGAVFLAACLQVFLGTDTAGNMIANRLNEAIPGRVNWDGQQVSFLKGRVRLFGLEIKDPEKQKVLSLKEFSANLGLKELFSAKILVASAKIVGPEIFLETGPEGSLNIVRAFVSGREKNADEDEDEKAAAFPNVKVKNFEIRQGAFSFKGRDGLQHVFLEEFGLKLADADLARRSGMLEFSVRGGSAAVSGMEFPIDRFFAKTALAEGNLDPLEVEFESGGSRIMLTGSLSSVFADPVPEVSADITADLAEIGQILGLDADFSGRLRLAADLKGGPDNPKIEASLDTEGLRLARTAIREVIFSGRMKDRELEIIRLEAGMEEGTVETSGTVDLSSAFSEGFAAPPADLEAVSCSLDVRIADFLLSQIPGMGGFRGALSGTVGVESTGISLEKISARADAGLRLSGIGRGEKIGPADIDLEAAAGMEDGRVRIERMDAAGPGLLVSAKGFYDIFDNSLDIDTGISVYKPAQVASVFGVSGVRGENAAVSARVWGKAARPAVRANVTAESPGFGDIEIERFKAGIGFAAGRLELYRAEIARHDSLAGFSGSIQLLDPDTFSPVNDPAVDLSFETNDMNLDDFISGISGTARASGSIGGSIKDPSGRVSARARQIDTGIQKIPKLRLESVISDKRAYLEPLEIFIAPGQGVTAEGWVSADLGYEISVTSEPLDLSAIGLLEHAGLKGYAEIAANGSGSLDSPDFNALVRLTGLEAEGKSIPDTDVRAALQGGSATVSILEPFVLNAAYGLSDQEFSAEAEFSETELAPFFSLAGMEGFTGTVTGNLRVLGNAKNVMDTEAQLNIAGLEAYKDNQEIAASKDLSASFENREIKISKSRIHLLRDGYVDVSGTGGIEGNLEILAEGSLPAKLAEAVSEEIHSPQGSISFEAGVQGTIESPDLRADVSLENLGFGLSATMQKLHSLNGRINVTDRKISVSGLSGRLDDGAFSVEGEVELDDFAPVYADLDITTEALPVAVPDMMEMTINSSLRLSGSPDESRLSGQATLVEGQYYKDVNLNLVSMAGDIGQRRRRPAAGRQVEIPVPDAPFARNLSLDVSVGHRNPFVVDNNLALLSVRPQLSVAGTLENPVITGRAEISEGTVAFRNTEFEVKRGVVDFVDPYRIAPEVDIMAESQIRKWLITLEITGPPENLDFRLSSEPPEEDQDIVSLLAVGKTTREMAGSAGGESNPEQMLADVLAERLERQVRESTGFDTVEMKYRSNGEGSEGDQMEVTVGKELSRRLTVKYGLERKSGEMVQQSTGIYRLFENLSVNAYQDTAGSYGGEMRYRLEFR